VATDSDLIANRLGDCVKILNQLRIHAYELIAVDIARIIEPLYMDTTQESSTARPVLSEQDMQDLDDILNNDAFYYELCTLLCNGELGPQSQYRRVLAAPPMTMVTRSGRGNPSTAPRAVKVPHAVRAYNTYAGASGFQPFKNQVRHLFHTAVARLTMKSVKHAMRGHYLGSKVRQVIECYLTGLRVLQIMSLRLLVARITSIVFWGGHHPGGQECH
jgi:hypothetical protein